MDVATGLPLAWEVHTASKSEVPVAKDLMDAALKRGFNVSVGIMDKGCDGQPLHDECMRRGIAPVIALKETEGVKKGGAEPPHCVHGDWKFAGADYKRKATKWRCPTGECTAKSMWLRADRMHPLIPRGSDRFKKLYRQRSAVDREFGRLEHEWSLLPLRVRGLDRVRLQADLPILARLSCALARTRTMPLAA